MQITKGITGGALKCCVYGPEGIGKSTFAAQFPNPVFIDTEGSTKFMNVARTTTPSSWAMLTEQVQYFRSHPQECGTLIIDTADWAETLCLNKICAEKHITSIEDIGYGKGYIFLEEDFGRLLNLLEDVINAGINVVLNCHAQMRKFEQPDELGAYDRWELKLEKKTSALVKEWADIILFANYKTFVVNVDNQGVLKGKNKVQGGKRTMYATHHNCWDAKNRHGLPDELPFEFAQISHLFKVAAPAVVTQPTEKAPKLVTSSAPTALTGEKPSEQPPQSTSLSEAPVQEQPQSRFTELPDGKTPETDRTGIPRALLDLMDEAKILPFEVEAAVAKKHIFPADMKIKDMPLDYINGVLIGAWPQIRKVIEDDPSRLPF